MHRIDLGGYIYHVINRANARIRIFHNDSDYKEFEYLLTEIKETYNVRILAYALMPNHWHLLLYPRNDGDMSKALHWLTTSHARRHHIKNKTIGNGHLYQGRYKSFIIKGDKHLLTVLKYIERNPARARLCNVAEAWRWGSAFRRVCGTTAEQQLLAGLPLDLPKNYLEWINTPEPSEELKAIRHSVNMGVPYGG